MTSGDDTHLFDYLAMLREHALLVVVAVLSGAALGYVAIGLFTPSYAATTSVIVRPTIGDTNIANGRTNAAINLDTEAQIVTSSVVAKIAADRLDTTESTRALRKRVSVVVPANTSVLNITFRAASPQGAVRGSKAFAAAYLENRTALTEDRLHLQVQNIEQRIASLNTALRSTTEKLASARPGVNQVLLTTERDLLVRQIRASTSELDPLYTEDVDPGSVLTEAQLPRHPSGWSPTLVLVSGLSLGLLAGLGGAVLRGRTDARVRSAADLTRLGVNVLVPTFALAPADEVQQRGRHSPEAMRQLRNVLLAMLPAHRGSLTVAATSPGDAGAATAASLAMTFARSGIETILVSANTHSHAVAEIFGLDSAIGLADVLRSGRSILDAVHPVEQLDRLAVIPAGADGVLISEQLEGSAVEQVVGELQDLAEIVVLDVAPTTVNADAQTVVTATDGLLLVATAGTTKTTEVSDAAAQLTNVGANALGAVVVAPSQRHILGRRRRRPRQSVEPATTPSAGPWLRAVDDDSVSTESAEQTTAVM